MTRSDSGDRTGLTRVGAGRVHAALDTAFCIAFVLYLNPAFGDRHVVYFAEPYSGKKVTQYSVELPVSRDETQTYEVPGDCAAVMQVVSGGARRWRTRVERGVWWKVERDCRYHEFLNRYSATPAQDFVSGYDFMNAYLGDLPTRIRCRYPDTDPGDPECQPLPPGVPEISHLLPLADREPGEPSLQPSPCQLEEGIFRGRLVRDANGVHCVPDPAAPGFRVISTDYADVNGDGVLDVVLRLVPLAPGASRMPLILPLTRITPDGAFDVPKEIKVPSIGRLP